VIAGAERGEGGFLVAHETKFARSRWVAVLTGSVRQHMKPYGQFATAVLLACTLPFVPSCSMLFVRKLPPVSQRTRDDRCTTSQVAPGFDVALAALQTARTALALSLTDADYKGSVLSRDSDIAIGVALAALFTVSAGVGFSATTECRKVMAEPGWGLQGARRRPTASARAEEQEEEQRIEREAEARARARQAETAKAAGEAATEAANRASPAPRRAEPRLDQP